MVNVVHTGDIHYGCTSDSHKIIEAFVKDLPECDVLLLGGDIISHSQLQWEAILDLISSRYDGKETFKMFVMGNHDYWGMKNYEKDFTHIMQLMRQHKIYLPEEQGMPLIFDDIAFYGFGGWYACNEPPSTDLEYIPKFLLGKGLKGDMGIHDLLFRKAVDSKNKIVEMLPHYKKSVIFTHFEMNTHIMGAPLEWLEDFREQEQERLIVCVGHSHIFEACHKGKHFSLYNHGSDYNEPRYNQFDI